MRDTQEMTTLPRICANSSFGGLMLSRTSLPDDDAPRLDRAAGLLVRSVVKGGLDAGPGLHAHGVAARDQALGDRRDHAAPPLVTRLRQHTHHNGCAPQSAIGGGGLVLK